MISAEVGPDRGLGERLTTKAVLLARTALENRRRAHRLDPLRWRNPSLLWPLFTRD
jgi:hypothetical protein